MVKCEHQKIFQLLKVFLLVNCLFFQFLLQLQLFLFFSYFAVSVTAN